MNPSNSKWYQSPKFWWAFGVLFAAILIDQIIKIYIKTNFIYGESYPIFGNWFKLYFIENEGMAFGMKLFGGGTIGKLVLTFFRIIVSIFGVYYLIAIIRKKEHTGLLIAVSLVLAGAIGNIIDSVFYGYYFGDRNLLPWESTSHYINTYGGQWFEGHVVDMFYAPMWEGVLPSWIPFWGGDFFTFFAPIWNFADACITVGVVIMIIGQKQFSLPSPSILFEKPNTQQNIQHSEHIAKPTTSTESESEINQSEN